MSDEVWFVIAMCYDKVEVCEYYETTSIIVSRDKDVRRSNPIRPELYGPLTEGNANRAAESLNLEENVSHCIITEANKLFFPSEDQ